MLSVLRSLGAVLAGAIVAVLLVAAIEALSMLIYPPSADVDWNDPEQVKAVIAKAPLGAMLYVLLAWFTGTLCGSWLAARLAGRGPVWHGGIVGALILVAAVINMATIPHPAWFWAAGLAVFPVATMLGAVVAGPKARRSAVANPPLDAN